MTLQSFAHKYGPFSFGVPTLTQSKPLAITDTIENMGRAKSPSMRGSDESKKDDSECIILQRLDVILDKLQESSTLIQSKKEIQAPASIRLQQY